jgi:hypothetical protein
MSTAQNSLETKVKQLQTSNEHLDAIEILHIILDRLHTSENRVNSLKAQNKQLTADLHDEVLSRIHWEKRFKQLKKQTGQ